MDRRPLKRGREERLHLRSRVRDKWHRILLTRTPAEGPLENHSGKEESEKEEESVKEEESE